MKEDVGHEWKKHSSLEAHRAKTTLWFAMDNFLDGSDRHLTQAALVFANYYQQAKALIQINQGDLLRHKKWTSAHSLSKVHHA